MKTFEEKLNSMTAKDVVLTMIAGLEKQWVQVCMDTYGGAHRGICYGCAATNTICQINGKAFDEYSILNLECRSNFIHGDIEVIDYFEAAIDSLRKGDLLDYNWYVNRAGLPHLKFAAELIYKGYPSLPELQDNSFKENLQAYRDFANTL